MTLDRWLVRAAGALGLLLIAGGLFHIYSVQSMKLGAAQVQERQAKQDAAAARAEAAEIKKREVVLVAQLDTMTRRSRASSARVIAAAADYEAERDTLVITDTAAVRAALDKADLVVAEAKRAVADAEAERAAAFTLLAAKDERIQAIERENGALRRQIGALERQVPGKLSRTLTVAKWAGIGAVIGIALAR
jgi:chromosome segregation ATPase